MLILREVRRGQTFVSSESLFAGEGSKVEEAPAEATLLIVPANLGVTRIVTEAEDPFPIVPRTQVTLPSDWVQVP